jgi:hypothetical protein
VLKKRKPQPTKEHAMKKTIRTTWGTDIVALTADWSNPDSRIDGLPGYRAADFHCSPYKTLAIALWKRAMADDLDTNDKKVKRIVYRAIHEAEVTAE